MKNVEYDEGRWWLYWGLSTVLAMVSLLGFFPIAQLATLPEVGGERIVVALAVAGAMVALIYPMSSMISQPPYGVWEHD